MTHRLALNETPYPPLPSVQEAMVRAVARSHRYPEFHPRRLGERIAAWCGVPSESLTVGSGSVGVALRLLRAVLRAGEAMAYPWPAFDGYPLLGRMAGAHCAPVPLLPDGRQDLPALADLGVLEEGGESTIPIVEAWNKWDLLEEPRKSELTEVAEGDERIVPISAVTGFGLETLFETVANILTKNAKTYEFILSASDGQRLAWLHAHGEVIEESELVGEGEPRIRLAVRLNAKEFGRYSTL